VITPAAMSAVVIDTFLNMIKYYSHCLIFLPFVPILGLTTSALRYVRLEKPPSARLNRNELTG
jgi:hypothetical protein